MLYAQERVSGRDTIMQVISQKMQEFLQGGRALPKEHLVVGVRKLIKKLQKVYPDFIRSAATEIEVLENYLDRGRTSRILQGLEALVENWEIFDRDRTIQDYNEAKRVLEFQFTRKRTPTVEEAVELGISPEAYPRVKTFLQELVTVGEKFLQGTTEVEEKAFQARVANLAHRLVEKYSKENLIKGLSLPFLVTQEGFSFNEARAVGQYLVENGFTGFFAETIEQVWSMGDELLTGETNETAWDNGPSSQLVVDQTLGEDFVPLSREAAIREDPVCPACGAPLSEDLKEELSRQDMVICEACGIRIQLR